MKLYFIAGEDSGDMHAGNLIGALSKLQPNLQTRGVGGERMRAQGMKLVAHVKDINFMGFWEVLRNIRTIRRLFRTVEADIVQWQPDAVVLVDYPGFNLRLAPFLKQLGIRIFYYISPQVWAWKKGRVKKIQAFVDRMFVILPFEKVFYANEGVEVDFVGHPLLDEISRLQMGNATLSNPGSPKTIALLPGSRKQEIKRMLPLMLELSNQYTEHQFIIAGAPSQSAEFYQQIIGIHPVELRMNQTYQVLAQADLAIVTSGTATLETALFGVPQVVCYKGAWLSYLIGKQLVQVKYISLVNLILDRPAVTELIQHDYHIDRLREEVERLMQPSIRESLQQDYTELHRRLGDGGASAETARLILQRM